MKSQKEKKPPAGDPASGSAQPAVPQAATGADMTERSETQEARFGQLVQFGVRAMKQDAVAEKPAASAPAIVEAKRTVQPAPRPQPQSKAPQLTPARLKKPKSKARRRHRIGAILSFLVLVALPAVTSYVYFGFYAANQYVSQAKYAIRAQIPAGAGKNPFEGGGSSLSLGFANYGIPSIADTFIVADYIQSAQVLKDVAATVDLRKIYSYEGADWLYRLDPAASDEALLDYWHHVSTVYYDITTGISTFTVRAFTPEDAQKVGQAVLAASQKLVSDMSRRAQNDALADARNEVDASKKRLDLALDKLEQFQQQQKQFDPLAMAKGRSEIEGKLEGEISALEAQLTAQLTSLSETAPTVKLLRTQIESMRNQLVEERAKSAVGGTAPGETAAVSSLLVGFDRLNVEREFATKAYASALAVMELAHQEATRQSRYLAAFVPPQLPDDTLYPNRPYFIATAMIGGILVWLLFRLVVSIIREHV
jgi:capsular polysaccharide transport system permease protein